jgi:hypothetical protein
LIAETLLKAITILTSPDQARRTPDRPGCGGGTPVVKAALRAPPLSKFLAFLETALVQPVTIRCYIRDPDGYIIEVGQSNPGVAYG